MGDKNNRALSQKVLEGDEDAAFNLYLELIRTEQLQSINETEVTYTLNLTEEDFNSPYIKWGIIKINLVNIPSFKINKIIKPGELLIGIDAKFSNYSSTSFSVRYTTIFQRFTSATFMKGSAPEIKLKNWMLTHPQEIKHALFVTKRLQLYLAHQEYQSYLTNLVKAKEKITTHLTQILREEI